MTTLAEHTAEAIASWAYNLPFSDLLGEREDPTNPGHSEIWFRLSRHAGQHVSAKSDPKQVVFVVRREKGDNAATVTVSWLNMSGPEPVTGLQNLRVSTYMTSESAVMAALEVLLAKVLEIYKDVLEETGVAGPLEMLAPEVEESDPELEFDMARTDEEVGRQ